MTNHFNHMNHTLSDAIIYDSAEAVQQLATSPDLNKFDEYGYTPLIQTAIVNDTQKAQIVINAGADVNGFDLTGRTALHWAAENNNLELCKLLLKHKANPNAYTRAGQPVLVMPLLRNYRSITKLIRSRGGDLNFAQDFINTKLLGHRFELLGQVDIVDNTNTFIEINYEGFYLEFTVALALHSLLSFQNNYAARNLRPLFNQIGKIATAIHIASKLISYQNYLVNVEQNQSTIQKLLSYPLRMIPVAYQGHAISFMQLGPYFARCDRGAFGKKHGTAIIYVMKHPELFTDQLIQKLMYTRQHSAFIERGIDETLDLIPLMTLPLSPQTAGNCSWANTEGSAPIMLAMLLLYELHDHSQQDLKIIEKEAMNFYENWVEWDKRIALIHCIDAFKYANKARRASKAAVLAAIFFQSCDYDDPKDREKVKKILPILTNAQYRYILKSYVDVYCKDSESEDAKRLLGILDDFGIDASQL